MKFEVLRHHEGDRSYAPGDVREAEEAEVRHLVASGVLSEAHDEVDPDARVDVTSTPEDVAGSSPEAADPAPDEKAVQTPADKAVKTAPKNKAG